MTKELEAIKSMKSSKKLSSEDMFNKYEGDPRQLLLQYSMIKDTDSVKWFDEERQPSNL